MQKTNQGVEGGIVPACFLVLAYPGRPRKWLQNIF